ncbi:helix-turn-helix protein [anaerobic digester metagenome]
MFFGKNLRYLRLAGGFSQEQIGDLVGKNFTTIQRWESGATEPSLGLTAILAAHFDVTIDDMVNKDIELDKADPFITNVDSFLTLKSALDRLYQDNGITDINQMNKQSYDALLDQANHCMNLYLQRLA